MIRRALVLIVAVVAAVAAGCASGGGPRIVHSVEEVPRPVIAPQPQLEPPARPARPVCGDEPTIQAQARCLARYHLALEAWADAAEKLVAEHNELQHDLTRAWWALLRELGVAAELEERFGESPPCEAIAAEPCG